MLPIYQAILVRQAQYEDYLREAERAQLARAMAQNVAAADGWSYRLIRWLGGRLVAWGLRMHRGGVDWPLVVLPVLMVCSGASCRACASSPGWRVWLDEQWQAS